MALATRAERKTLKILCHAPAVASTSFGSRTMQLQLLMLYIVCCWWGEDVFMRPAAMKAPLCWPALHPCIVPGLLINVKCGWGTIPVVLSGANRERQGALKFSWGPISGSPCSLAVIRTTGLMVSDVGYASVYPTCVCVHIWDGGNSVFVFTPWLKISLPLHLTADWFDLADTIDLFHKLPPKKDSHCTSHLNLFCHIKIAHLNRHKGRCLLSHSN